MILEIKGLEPPPARFQPIDGFVGDSLAVPAFEPRSFTHVGKLKPHKGTTSLGFVCREGVILASCSSGRTGPSKVMEIDRYMLSIMVGEPIDKLFWKQCRLYQSRKKRRLPMSLASEILVSMICSYLGGDSEAKMVETLIAGLDVHGPALFCVDDDVRCATGHRFAVGSGSSYAYDDMDSTGFRFLCHMMADEAASFARWAIRRAAFQDGVADGVATVYYVGPHGWELLAYDDAGNPGPYYPVTMNSDDQEMTEEDARWLGRLEFKEYSIAGTTLFRIHLSQV